MFTGLIRDQGTIRAIDGGRMRIAPSRKDFPLGIGASIACNGICLTITEIKDGTFSVDVSDETKRCTTAGNWREGDILNLEPALVVGDAIGGHFVSGHVDGVVTIVAKEASVWTFEAPKALAKFIAPKGSVTLDGVSLTVNEVEGNRFTVNIIPHTESVTGFAALRAGDALNLEVDLLARYLARLTEAA